MNTGHVTADFPKSEVAGIPVTSEPPADPARWLVGREQGSAFLVTFVNPNACAVAETYPEYPVLLQAFDWVLCDGIGMVWAARRAGHGSIQRHSFDSTSLADPVLCWASERALATGLVGGAPGVAEQAAGVLRRAYPRLPLTRAFTGFGDDVEAALGYHVSRQTPIVVCGMGAPRQEDFLLQLKRRGWTGTGFTCGGFLDQLQHGLKYYPGWVDKLNLRFAYRLLREPRRLARRYLVDYRAFLRRVAGLDKQKR